MPNSADVLTALVNTAKTLGTTAKHVNAGTDIYTRLTGNTGTAPDVSKPLAWGAIGITPKGEAYYGEGIKGWARKTWAKMFDPTTLVKSLVQNPDDPTKNMSILDRYGFNRSIYSLRPGEILSEQQIQQKETEEKTAIKEINSEEWRKIIANDPSILLRGAGSFLKGAFFAATDILNLPQVGVRKLASIALEAKLDAEVAKLYPDSTKQERVNNFMTGSEMIYSVWLDVNKRDDYIRAVMDGETPAYAVERLANPWIEFGGSLILDPLNLIPGKAATKIDMIDDFSKVANPKVAEALDLLGKVNDPNKVGDLLTGFVKTMDDWNAESVKRISTLADKRGLLNKLIGQTMTSKADIMAERVNEIFGFIAKQEGKNVDEVAQVLVDLIRSRSKDLGERTNALLNLTQKPYARTLFSNAGHDAMMFIEKFAEGDLAKATKQILEHSKGDYVELAEFVAKAFEKVSEETFPTVKMMEKAFDTVSKAEDISKVPEITKNLAKAYQEMNPIIKKVAAFDDYMQTRVFFGKFGYKHVNRFFSSIYMGMNPGYAMRNMLNGTIHLWSDTGIESAAKGLAFGAGNVIEGIFLRKKTPSLIQREITKLEGYGAELFGTRALAGTGIGGEIIEREIARKGAVVLDLGLEMGQETEKGMSIASWGTSFIREMERALRNGAIPSAKELTTLGMPQSSANWLVDRALLNKGDIVKTIRDFRDDIAKTLGANGIAKLPAFKAIPMNPQVKAFMQSGILNKYDEYMKIFEDAENEEDALQMFNKFIKRIYADTKKHVTENASKISLSNKDGLNTTSHIEDTLKKVAEISGKNEFDDAIETHWNTLLNTEWKARAEASTAALSANRILAVNADQLGIDKKLILEAGSKIDDILKKAGTESHQVFNEFVDTVMWYVSDRTRYAREVNLQDLAGIVTKAATKNGYTLPNLDLSDTGKFRDSLWKWFRTTAGPEHFYNYTEKFTKQMWKVGVEDVLKTINIDISDDTKIAELFKGLGDDTYGILSHKTESSSAVNLAKKMIGQDNLDEVLGRTVLRPRQPIEKVSAADVYIKRWMSKNITIRGDNGVQYNIAFDGNVLKIEGNTITFPTIGSFREFNHEVFEQAFNEMSKVMRPKWTKKQEELIKKAAQVARETVGKAEAIASTVSEKAAEVAKVIESKVYVNAVLEPTAESIKSAVEAFFSKKANLPVGDIKETKRVSGIIDDLVSLIDKQGNKNFANKFQSALDEVYNFANSPHKGIKFAEGKSGNQIFSSFITERLFYEIKKGNQDMAGRYAQVLDILSPNENESIEFIIKKLLAEPGAIVEKIEQKVIGSRSPAERLAFIEQYLQDAGITLSRPTKTTRLKKMESAYVNDLLSAIRKRDGKDTKSIIASLRKYYMQDPKFVEKYGSIDNTPIAQELTRKYWHALVGGGNAAEAQYLAAALSQLGVTSGKPLSKATRDAFVSVVRKGNKNVVVTGTEAQKIGRQTAERMVEMSKNADRMIDEIRRTVTSKTDKGVFVGDIFFELHNDKGTVTLVPEMPRATEGKFSDENLDTAMQKIVDWADQYGVNLRIEKPFRERPVQNYQDWYSQLGFGKSYGQGLIREAKPIAKSPFAAEVIGQTAPAAEKINPIVSAIPAGTEEGMKAANEATSFINRDELARIREERRLAREQEAAAGATNVTQTTGQVAPAAEFKLTPEMKAQMLPQLKISEAELDALSPIEQEKLWNGTFRGIDEAKRQQEVGKIVNEDLIARARAEKEALGMTGEQKGVQELAEEFPDEASFEEALGEPSATLEELANAKAVPNSDDKFPDAWEVLDKQLDNFLPYLMIDARKRAASIGKTVDTFVDASMEKALTTWQSKALRNVSDARAHATSIADAGRDFALLNYNNRTYLDKVLAYIYPYHFWYGRTYKNWTSRIVQHPQIVVGYARYRKLLEQLHPGMPDWWKYNLSSNDLTGMDSENPLYFNLEATLNPLQGLVGVDFNDPNKRVNWWSKTIDDMGKFGPTLFTPINWMVAGGLYAQGEKDAATRWMGRLFPQTTLLKSALYKLGVQTPLPYNEFDPFVQAFSGGIDPYERRRVGRVLGQMVEDGVISAEAAQEAAHTQTGDVWTGAVATANANRFGPQFASFFAGVGFKARSESDKQIDQFYNQYNGLWMMKDEMSPDKFNEAMRQLKETYPWMDVLLMSRKPTDQRDGAYAYSVMGRIPPGQKTEISELADIDDLLDRFYNDKGDLSAWTKSDKERFMAGIVDIGAVLAVPDNATQREYYAASDAYKAMIVQMEKRFGSDIQTQTSYYYSLPNAQRKTYLQMHPALDASFQFRNQFILSNPILNKYYGGISVLEQYYTNQMYYILDTKFPGIRQLWDEYDQLQLISTKKATAFKNSYPEMKRYTDMQNQLKNEMIRIIAALGSKMPEAPQVPLRPEVPQSQRQEDIATQAQPPYEYTWQDFQQVLSPAMQQLILDYATEGKKLPYAANTQLDYLAKQLGMYDGDELLERVLMSMYKAQTP